MQRSTRCRGGVLATVLVLSFVCLLIFWAAYSEAFTYLGIANRRGNLMRAHQLARAAVATALVELQNDPDFPQRGRVFFEPDALGADGSGLLTFDPSATRYYSTDNITGEEAAFGAGGQVVPAQSVDLVGVGRFRNETVVIREIYRIPRWDAALASSGPMEITGRSTQTVVAALADPGALVDGLQPDDLAPGKLVANGSAGSGPALRLDGIALPGGAASIRVVGEARHHGALQQSSAGVAFERGGPLSLSEPDSLPELDPAAYDPVDRPHVTLPRSDFATPETLSGFVRWEGSGTLVFRQGLHLNGGLLFVAGDVEVRGGLTGTGALVATGKTTLTGANSLSADSMVAVLSGGDLRIAGSGSERSWFAGLVVANGDELVVEDVTVTGTVLANGRGPGGSTLRVEDSRVVFDPRATTIEVEVGWPAFPRRPMLPADVQIAPVTPADFLDPGPPPRYVWDPSKVKLSVDGQVYDGVPDLWTSPKVRRDVADYLGDARSLIEHVLQGLPPPDPGRSPMVLSFDLNRYLNTSGRLKSLFWQRL